MGELAGDECSIRKRATCCILPRKSPRDRFRTLDTKRVIADVEGGQWGAEQTVNKRAEEGKMGELAGDECIIRKRAASCILPRKCRRDRDRPFLPDLVNCEIQAGQGGADQTVKKRAEEGKWVS